ncbi:hypothetical protein ACXYTJ_03455 [Gilvimarinus sp. F26214L]|uniref:hypothetical protein n=1 Tax=Gilvimarinus sp. DZF01 TaxID=3461371 RepID=UPI00404592B5
MEPISAALTAFGIAILLISWGMMLITSFKEDMTWGLSTLFLPPLSYLYGLFQWSKAKEPILAAVLGLVLLILA